MLNMDIDFNSPICRLCLNSVSSFTPVPSSQQLSVDIFELMQIQIIDLPGRPATVICHPCKMKVEMFIEFKKNCIRSNDRFMTSKDKIKVETPSSETEYGSISNQSHDDHEIKHVVVHQDNQLFEALNVPIENVVKLQKISTKNTKPERDVCSYCGKTFLFLSQHIKSMHSRMFSNVKRFTCGLCFEFFSERSLFKLHIDSLHDGKMYHCDICGKRDKSLGGLTRHIRSHSKIRPYSCELCGKLFRYSKHLFEHKLRHANNRRFKCEICEKRFFTHTEISSHRLIHASDRSFKCKVCQKGFKRPDHVRSHMRIHLKDKSFACKICEKEFSYKHNMVFHMKNVHGTVDYNTKK